MTLHRPINLCSIYLPSHQQIDEDKLKNLIQQVSKPFIFQGDINSHNILSGCKENETKGNKIENFINKNDLCLLNPANSLDLTMCDPSIFLDFSWNTFDVACESDHYPIILNNEEVIHDHIPTWKLSRANWEKIHELCLSQLTEENIQTIEKFMRTLIIIAEKCIPTYVSSKKKNRPWFDKECKKTIN